MARKNASIPQSNKLWTRFVQIRLEVLCRALDILNITEKMKENEDDITEALNPKIAEASFEHKDKPEPPALDAKIGALTDDELDSKSIIKRPDFTYLLRDQAAENVEMFIIRLHIECKCIGNNRSPSWNLNMNYINNGIKRFDSISHNYGENAPDGIMIGYIISSNKSVIQNKINDKLPENIEKLDFKNEDKVERISTKFIRENVKPKNFTMHHIWADYTKELI